MRSAAAPTLPVRPSEEELRNALSNSISGHNHVSRPAQFRGKTSSDPVNSSSVHHHGHNRDNADKCDSAEGPWNLSNPVKASRSHQELHKELLLAHKKGLAVSSRPELQMVLERRKREQTQREEGEQNRSPLEHLLLQRQHKQHQIMKEQEEEQKLQDEVQLLEFVRVRQNLRKVHTALQKNIHHS